MKDSGPQNLISFFSHTISAFTYGIKTPEASVWQSTVRISRSVKISVNDEVLWARDCRVCYLELVRKRRMHLRVSTRPQALWGTVRVQISTLPESDRGLKTI